MKKPYVKKIGKFDEYSAWYVDGFWIRNNYDKEFTNLGFRRYFKFIPKNEIWIDYENKNKEAKYFIGHFLTLKRELKKGKSFEKAVSIADEHERSERNKSKSIKELKKIKQKHKILKKIHKKQLFSKYTKKIKIWLVRGDLVRGIFFLNFTEGGHDRVYDFIPKDEIWVDDSLCVSEIPCILVHELHERYLIGKGWIYDSKGIGVFSRKPEKGKKSAHFEAEKVETYCRNHLKDTKKILVKEIRLNEE